MEAQGGDANWDLVLSLFPVWQEQRDNMLSCLQSKGYVSLKQFFFSLSLTQQILEGERHTALLRQNEGHYSQSSGELPAAKSFKAISSALESPWCLAHHRNLPSTLCGLLCKAYVGERFGENG